ncbi:uncharacterized protein LOC132543703 [Ylistrum balloti]|uniref:uncharacterized protein LOC132543703 n=1 Tax=Ylistrum balloti TaxID=509963 RepID=UPI002905F207|nr:uncharacterized protein LOC132543703 [Ylistrum balloti]
MDKKKKPRYCKKNKKIKSNDGDKMGKKGIFKKQLHITSNEQYNKEVKSYKEEAEENKSRVNIGILIYAAQHDKQEDLKYFHQKRNLRWCLQKLLKYALNHGDEDLALWFLQEGEDLTKLVKHSTPLLHLAVEKGYSIVLNELLQRPHVDVNARNRNKDTALQLALTKENPTICRILLEYGARTDIPNRNGMLPLHQVTQASTDIRLIDLLIEFKADIEALDEHGMRPIEYALQKSINRQGFLRKLISHGAMVGKKFESKLHCKCMSAIQVGQKFGITKLIMRELRKRSPEINSKDISVLDCVNLTGDIGSLVDLLKEDGDISTLSQLDKSAILTRLFNYITWTGSHRLHQCLQERGIIADDENKTWLHKTGMLLSQKHVAMFHVEVMDDLEFILSRHTESFKEHMDVNSIESVVTISPATNEGAVMKVFALVMQHLLNTVHGFPAKSSIRFRHIHTREFLTNHSLPEKICSNEKYSSLLSEDTHSDTCFLKEIYEFHVAKNDVAYECHSLHNQILHKGLHDLEKNWNDSEYIHSTDNAGWTPLHLAIVLGESEIVKILLDHGANTSLYTTLCLPAFVCAKSNRNIRMQFSPLDLAVRLNMNDIVQLITERSPANPSMKAFIKMSYGLELESTLLQSVCKEAERKYKDIGARFKPTYTVRKNQAILRVCLGFTDDVCDVKEGDIHGVKVIIMNPNIAPESEWIEDDKMTENEEIVCKAIVDRWADNLWNQHPNLNAITAGSIVSVKCPKANPEAHIMLHCSHKGYIPLASQCFPTELKCEKGAMPVAVLEGEFIFSPRSYSLNAIDISHPPTGRCRMETTEHIPLKVGMSICGSHGQEGSVGTLGIFVEIGNGKTGFITCSHLFHAEKIEKGDTPFSYQSSQEKKGDDVIAPFDHFYEKHIRGVKRMEIDDDPLVQLCENVTVYWQCGNVERAVFNSDLETGIDAALVVIDPNRNPRDGSFDDVKYTHLKNAEMNVRDHPTFASGKQADVKYLDNDCSPESPIRCMKLGAGSGLSVGLLTWTSGQARTSDSDKLGIKKDSSHKYTFKGQYVISGLKGKQFFEEGDSGSAVFVMIKRNKHYYPDACLGIAIGFAETKTFVTPIGNILEALKLDEGPALTLKQFVQH